MRSSRDAAVDAVVQRVQTGHWGQTTSSAALNTSANALPGLDGGNFAGYQPTKLVVQPVPLTRN